MKVYERLDKFIKENGIKQSFIAERTGIDKSTISAILNGHRKLKADELDIICKKAINKSPSIFFNDIVLENKIKTM